jgi:murein DD-endopeptidase MepM/ murein hydrolase activator NlpD
MVPGIITSRFGELAPGLHRGPHTGVDIAAPLGAPVRATAPGKVLLVGYEKGGYGLYVVIEHGAGLSTLYAHLEMAFVRRGDQVMRGQVIGRVGSSGRSTGPHLHYEVRLAGRPVDPGPYIWRWRGDSVQAAGACSEGLRRRRTPAGLCLARRRPHHLLPVW